ncbi:Tryptophan synthase alpha chain [Usitatibacter rugosus]|uniref:Tryptophan synthase alpha chain n=1 Tax=Usitatibacter rugosus TaxID=2732067 RepID=A0A6M4GT69_9PROT|nr:tryptophan synthase subunit alpha [Usitatibacter rugosus]QJR10519.1 Tryptophan synthase alpha chain [Usitatibacter rugosus]
MSRIAATFEKLRAQKRAALIPFVTAGDPAPEHMPAIMKALVAGGADVIELGVPFSDPMADGPAIQRSSERALKHNVGLRDVLAFVAAFRKTNDSTPVVLMGYANPVERMGFAAFVTEAKKCGIDGVLIVDYPPEESGPWLEALAGSGIDPIFLLSPTSTDTSIERVAKVAAGYVYYVSLKGVTGAANIDTKDVEAMMKRIRSRTQLPVGVGFGIRDGATAKRVAGCADAVVIGSRIVQEIAEAPGAEIGARVEKLVREFRTAIDSKESVAA